MGHISFEMSCSLLDGGFWFDKLCESSCLGKRRPFGQREATEEGCQGKAEEMGHF